MLNVTKPALNDGKVLLHHLGHCSNTRVTLPGVTQMPVRLALLCADLGGRSGKDHSDVSLKLKPLASMESFRRPGGVRTLDLQRQVALQVCPSRSPCTQHQNLGGERFLPQQLEIPAQQLRKKSVLFTSKQGICVCMRLTDCW